MPGTASRVGQRDDVPDALDFVAERPRFLAAHVLEQIDLIFSEAGERRMALKLAEGLDEAGYCRLEAPAVAQALNVSLETIEGYWARLRQIEPAGLFSRTLAECLGAQLTERNRLDPAMKALLDHLDLVAAGELGQLRRRCGVDDEDLRDMLAELRTLDPRPGQKFDYEPIQPVAPEIGHIGAYSLALRTHFNGFYPDTFVEVTTLFEDAGPAESLAALETMAD